MEAVLFGNGELHMSSPELMKNYSNPAGYFNGSQFPRDGSLPNSIKEEESKDNQ